MNGSQLDNLAKTVAANKTKYYSVNSTAIGNVNNDGATGPNASANGGQAIAIGSGQSGQNTVASGQQSIAIGANVVSKGHSSIAIGGDDLDDASKANINGISASTLNGGDVNTTFSPTQVVIWLKHLAIRLIPNQAAPPPSLLEQKRYLKAHYLPQLVCSHRHLVLRLLPLASVLQQAKNAMAAINAFVVCFIRILVKKLQVIGKLRVDIIYNQQLT
ncbi:hypothetical protein AS194_06325 [Psychrobacter piscatorii]|uniref:Trimeric autotransporter adhesin YadA-like head domain-containing protein n=1 Tax=Psychrobacter piscatorii TaxID=554343 RepID=A0A0T6DST4_9GAMM|nr:hypothetical protein AS194_06325 [Psychrobacter piscatorii]